MPQTAVEQYLERKNKTIKVDADKKYYFIRDAKDHINYIQGSEETQNKYGYKNSDIVNVALHFKESALYGIKGDLKMDKSPLYYKGKNFDQKRGYFERKSLKNEALKLSENISKEVHHEAQDITAIDDEFAYIENDTSTFFMSKGDADALEYYKDFNFSIERNMKENKWGPNDLDMPRRFTQKEYKNITADVADLLDRKEHPDLASLDMSNENYVSDISKSIKSVDMIFGNDEFMEAFRKHTRNNAILADFFREREWSGFKDILKNYYLDITNEDDVVEGFTVERLNRMAFVFKMVAGCLKDCPGIPQDVIKKARESLLVLSFSIRRTFCEDYYSDSGVRERESSNYTGQYFDVTYGLTVEAARKGTDSWYW